MIAHVVCWKLKDKALGRTKAENLAEMKTRLEALVGVVPGIERLDVSTEIVGTTGDVDIVLYTEFADAGTLEAYQVHPAHKDVADFVGQIRESRFCVDYVI
jgi:hypothetical protein